MSDTPSSNAEPRIFPHTRWSVVLAARRRPSPESAEALESLCRAYWYPLYGFARRSGHSPHDAQDLTQEFFRRLLEKRWLDSADPGKGRLRTFLIVALKKFMIGEWRRAAAQRRGGRHPHIPIDTAFAESRYAPDADATLNVEEAFDRNWALTLHDLSLERLVREFESSGKTAEFEALKDCLMASRGSIDYSTLAKRLGATEGAARVAVHRLRKRFREIYREEVAQTLPDDENVEEEIRCLARALARG